MLTRSQLKMIKARLPVTGESIRSLSVARLPSKSRRLRKRPKMQGRKRGVTERPPQRSQKKKRRQPRPRLRRKKDEMVLSRR